MKSFGLLLLLILFCSCVAQFFLPWWSVVPVCFGLAMWQAPTGGRAFVAGLLGTGLSWWLPAAWLNLHGTERLASRLATLLPLGGSSWLLVIATGVVVGLVGGLAALSGAWARQALAPTAKSSRTQPA